MPGWLFDSVALIDWYCGRSGVAPYVENVLLGKVQGAFSTITEIELWQGLRPGEEEDHLALLALLDESLSTALSPSRRGACDNRLV